MPINLVKKILVTLSRRDGRLHDDVDAGTFKCLIARKWNHEFCNYIPSQSWGSPIDFRWMKLKLFFKFGCSLDLACQVGSLFASIP